MCGGADEDIFIECNLAFKAKQEVTGNKRWNNRDKAARGTETERETTRFRGNAGETRGGRGAVRLSICPSVRPRDTLDCVAAWLLLHRRRPQLLLSRRHPPPGRLVILILPLKPNPKPLRHESRREALRPRPPPPTESGPCCERLTRFFSRADSSLVSEENLTKAVPRSGLSRLMKLLPNLSRA